MSIGLPVTIGLPMEKPDRGNVHRETDETIRDYRVLRVDPQPY
jgi:hypothetical protein